MIHLSNLSVSLAKLDATTHLTEIADAAHALATVAETDPENPPVIGPGPHHDPGLPTQDSIYNAIKELKERLVGGDPLASVSLNPQPLPPREMPLQLNDR